MTVAAVVFDMDGLMVDTEPVYKASWQQAASELHYELPDSVYARFVGRPTEACERILVEHLGPKFPLPPFRLRWPVLWRTEIQRSGVHVKPGLFELLAFLSDRRVPVAVATSTESDLAALTLSLAGLADHFAIVVSGDQVAAGKPAPDIYLEAARRLGVSAANCVALEDSEAGIRAAAAAGMVGILVPHWAPSIEASRAARHVVEDLHQAREVLTSLIAEQERS
jgi:HAD superfamily hydrolase (TIGR01509 family)